MSDEPTGPGGFDYGERQADGQFERHPTVDDGEFVQPVRAAYVHVDGDCADAVTRMPTHLAESFARDPSYYDETFCAACGDYYPVGEFRWQGWQTRLDETDQAGGGDGS